MRKKAIAYEFLVRLLIAVIALAFVVSIASRCFRVTDEAEESFNRLADKIEEARGEGEGWTDSVRVDMDETSALIGFSKNAKRVIHLDHVNEGRLSHFNRPDKCESEKPCLCLCRNGWIKEASKITERGMESIIHPETKKTVQSYVHICEGKLLCHPFNNFDFLEKTTENIFAPKEVLAKSNEFNLYDLYGGFVLVNSVSAIKTNFRSIDERNIAVYIQKKDNDTVGVCLELPCV